MYNIISETYTCNIYECENFLQNIHASSGKSSHLLGIYRNHIYIKTFFEPILQTILIKFGYFARTRHLQFTSIWTSDANYQVNILGAKYIPTPTSHKHRRENIILKGGLTKAFSLLKQLLIQ